MAEKTLNTRVILKHDTFTNWSKTNVPGQGGNLVLKDGEIGICTIPGKTDNTGKIVQKPSVLMKVGDGSTAFTALPWMHALAADVYDWAKESSIYIEITGNGNAITSAEFKATENHPKGALVLTKGDTFALKSEIKNGVVVAKGTGIDVSSSTSGNTTTYTVSQSDVARTDTTSTGTPAFGGTVSVIDSVNSDEQGHILGVNTKTVTLPEETEITATDDGVVNIEATGTKKHALTLSHAQKGPSAGYTSANSVTEISGYDDSQTIKIPQLTVDKYGHVTAAKDEEISITMPSPQDLSQYAKKTEISSAMVFKGTLGSGGTVSALPPAVSGEGDTNTVGDTYKVITEGSYDGQSAKVGDVFICNTEGKWILIPSGDEPSGTVTNIATGEGLSGGPITDSGTISHSVPLGATEGEKGNTSKKVRTYLRSITTDKFGHITGIATGTETVVDTNTSHTHSAGVGLKVNKAGGTDEIEVQYDIDESVTFILDCGTSTKTV